MDVHVPLSETSKDAETITLLLTSPNNSSSSSTVEDKIVLVTPKRDFYIHYEVIKPVQESSDSEAGSAELVISTAKV